ncbi:MAG: sulfatase-like hydrolase/transferase [Planctomycetota bacterium]
MSAEGPDPNVPAPYRRLAFVAAVGALALLSFVVARAASVRHRPPVAPGIAVPGVVFVVVDTLRADALDADATTDGLARTRTWARDATTFRRALATSSWTAPSVASILTGRLPTAHGVIEVGPRTRLAASVRSLATMLREAGFATAACTGGGWVSPGAGFAAGFDRFDVDFDEQEPAAVLARMGAGNPTGRPFFYLLHTYAAHDPYGDRRAASQRRCSGDPSPEARALATALRGGSVTPELRQAFLREMLASPCGRLAVTREVGVTRATKFWLEDCRPFLDGGWRAEPGGAETVAYLRDAYRAALRHVDDHLAATLDAIDRLPRGTVVVVVGDHGEAFGEHEMLYHGRFVLPEMVRVPLIVRADGLPRGDVVDAPCCLTDLVPTVLDLAGLPVPTDLDGVSLRRAGRPDAPPRALVSVVAPGVTPDDAVDAQLRRVAVRGPATTWTGVLDTTTGTWGADVWYDRTRDPDEHHPLAKAPEPSEAPEVHAARARVREALESRLRGRRATGGVSGS